MPLPINVDDLLHQRKVEMTRIEYKSGWNPEPILHSICAFANDFDNMGGGYLFIGVDEENGRPVLPVRGIDPDSVDRIQLELLDKCNLIEPRCIPVIEPCTVDGRDVLVLWVPGGEDRPYKCPERVFSEKGRKSPKAYYIRKGARTLKANAREERELLSMARDIPFDDRVNYHAEVADLRPTLIADYLRAVGSELQRSALDRPVEDVAADMQLVRGPSEYRKPVNVGLMFFTERPDLHFPYARIEVVDKPDPTGIGMTEKTFTGPLDWQLRDALAYIRNYVVKEYVTKTPDSELAVRAFNWPFQAIEEALSNAVYHRSYQIHEPITVTVTPDRMEILSLPGPDRSISDADLRRGVLVSRRYRNRRIGDFLKELEIVEGRNTGVPLILGAMEANGSEPPSFETDEDRSFFLTVLPVHPLFAQGENAAETVSGENAGARRGRDELRQLIVDLLRDRGEMSVGELAAALGYKKATDTFRGVVKELLASGEIAYLYPDKPRSRNQKVRIAE